MLIISTISEASFRHVQGTTSRDLWLSLKKAYAPHSTSREYTLKTQLLRIKMHGDETLDAYLNRAQEYADALAAIGEPVKDKDLMTKSCNNKGTIDNIICQLRSAFALKDLGPLNYFLGIEIVLHVSGILLSQKKYILELLQTGLSNCNSCLLPWLPRAHSVCQYMHAPTENHWSVVKRILRYLHGTIEHGMLIRHSSGSTLQAFTDVLWKGNPDTSLEAFSDADWAGDSNDRRSTRGFAIYLEAEYKALADTVDELTWLQSLLNELGIRSSSTPIL
ncbi:retrovirus-related pol polyprotein from transposon TNT 1-94 [Tanacetum coccineum]